MSFDREVAQSTLDGLRLRWKQITGASRTRDVDRLFAWRAELVRLKDREAELRRAGRWTSGRADLLGIIGRGRRETYHCAILAWLLHPCRPHGLGVSFLRRFLAEVAADVPVTEDSLHRARVVVERAGKRTRADLVLSVRSLVVVVEAKVDARERTAQCEDLVRDFDREGDVRFVFLSPDGRRPETAKHTDPKWTAVSFRTVLTLLGEALEEQSSRPDANGEVESYLRTLVEEFGK